MFGFSMPTLRGARIKQTGQMIVMPFLEAWGKQSKVTVSMGFDTQQQSLTTQPAKNQ